MEGTSIRSSPDTHGDARIDGYAIWTWALCFGLVAYVGLKGGGYDPLVHDQVGIAVWWILIAGVLVGALPGHRPTALDWGALGLLLALVIWTALSLTWTESHDKTSAELARVAGYLGVLVLAVASRGTDGARNVIGGVGAGIVLVSIVALLSRLHPAWFPSAAESARLLNDPERLSYPVNYWNGLAALVAMGLPLLLWVATCAKSILLRALAAAAIPAMVLTAFLTLSRGGMAATIIAVAIFLAFASDRLPKLLTVLVAAVGSGVLIAVSLRYDALREGLLNATAEDQGFRLLAVTLVLCAGVGLTQAAISAGLRRGLRPRWTEPTRSQTVVASAVAVTLVLIGALAVGAPGRAADGWDEFKAGGGPGKGAERLGSVAGESRYQFWNAAVRQNATRPLSGTGAGTFEFWWARNGDADDTVRDAHSLYMQTLGELGIIGLALLAGYLLVNLVGGGRMALGAQPDRRTQLAAALAGFAAFCMIGGIDWIWQLPVAPIVLLLLGSALTSGSGARSRLGGGRLPLPLRLGFAVAALAAIAAIAIPLAATSLLRQSEADARDGRLDSALDAARSAQDVQPGAAAPRLQQALVLEEQGRPAAAEAAARGATDREATNWRNWLVLSRIEAEKGRAAAAVRDYRRAKSLNPYFSLFSE